MRESAAPSSGPDGALGRKQEKAEIRSLIIEGCDEIRDVYLEMERELHPLEEECEVLLRAPTHDPSHIED